MKVNWEIPSVQVMLSISRIQSQARANPEANPVKTIMEMNWPGLSEFKAWQWSPRSHTDPSVPKDTYFQQTSSARISSSNSQSNCDRPSLIGRSAK